MGKWNVRKTQEEYIDELYNVQPHITAIGQYAGSHTKIKMLCNIHNIEFEQSPTNALSGKLGCPICAKNNGYHTKKTHSEFVKEMQDKFPTIKVVGLYVDAKTNVQLECMICGNKWQATPDNLLHNKGCPQCSLQRRGKKKRKTNEQFLQEMDEMHPEMIVNSEYISSEVKVNCTCSVCGYNNDYYPATLTHGSGGCFVCGNRKISEALTMSEDAFISKLALVNNDVFVCGGYINASSHINVRCKVCNHEWSPIAKSLLQGFGCPRCASSHGERTIRNYLDRYDVEYTSQKTFDGLCGLGNGLLSYDFYLPEYNLLIEYQGEYHDGTAKIQTIEEFKKQQEHDKRKREYAKIHHFKMLEIWYWDFDNIEDILNNTLHNLVTTTAI